MCSNSVHWAVQPIFRIPIRSIYTTVTLFRNKNEIYNTHDRPNAVLDADFRMKIQEGYKHPRSIPVISPSQEFSRSVRHTFDKVLINYKDHLSSYSEAGKNLIKFIKHRPVPLEESEKKARKNKVEETIKKEFNVNDIDSHEDNTKILKRLKWLENRSNCKWAPIEFDETGSVTYLVTRTAAEFASLVTIFRQIKDSDDKYQPRTLFDFGSGVGSGLWAAREVFGQFTEAFMVDSSKHMNDLARLILDANVSPGDDYVPSGVSFRLQLPSTISLKYDLVICSNTLFELPSASERLSALNNIWDRVEDGGYLVLAETGTNAGFHLIAEARDFLIQISQINSDNDGDTDRSNNIGHSVAPCPHDAPCPRHTGDTIPCNFEIKYSNFQFDAHSKSTVGSELVSYFVFKKERRIVAGWPRLVETPVKTKTCIYCRLCTPNGTLQEALSRKKDDHDLFQLSKRLRWGDNFPVKLEKVTNRVKVGTPWYKKEVEVS